MLRALTRPLLAKVPYATLFAYNPVLQSVFEAPADRVALTVELPGQPVRDYTYGRLQRDVVALSNAVVRRRELVSEARGASDALSWMQPHKPSSVRSVFAQGERTPSCDVLRDTGVYNGAIMCGPGYAFVVSLLALWATNHAAVLVSQRFTSTQALTDARLLFVDAEGVTDLTARGAWRSSALDSVVVRRLADARVQLTGTETISQGGGEAPHACGEVVEAVFDMTALMKEQTNVHERLMHDGASELMEVELLDPAEDAFSTVLESAEDIVARLQKEKTAAEARELARQTDLLKRQHKEKHRVHEAAPALCFDTDALHQLNSVHRRWLDCAETRPHGSDDCAVLYAEQRNGAVHTHGSLSASALGMAAAWRMTANDRVLVQMTGARNVWTETASWLAALAAQSTVVVLPFGRDDISLLSQRLTRGDLTVVLGDAGTFDGLSRAVTGGMSPIEQTGFRHVLADQVRFCGCVGPVEEPIRRAWHAASRQAIVSTLVSVETGVALVQPLRGAATPPGMTLPPVPDGLRGERASAMVVPSKTGDDSARVTPGRRTGQLLLASPTVMDRYWRQASETAQKMVEDRTTGTRYLVTGAILSELPRPAHTGNDGRDATSPLFRFL